MKTHELLVLAFVFSVGSLQCSTLWLISGVIATADVMTCLPSDFAEI